MRWSPRSGEDDIEDRRGEGGGGRRFGGGGLRLGLGGIVIVGVLSLLTGKNFFALLQDLPTDVSEPTATQGADPQRDASEQPLVEFVRFVVGDSQDVWESLLGQRYRRAKLVLFRGAVASGCGDAEAAMGPFYCPADEKAYIDLAFYEDLKRRFGAPGDFAQAYVITHEIGHHVQNLLGIERQLRERQEARPRQRNELSVRMELQADCFAGAWGHATSKRGILEAGDVEEALNAAASIGDDRLQKQATGRVNPEGFTHGTSQQRVAWFKRGLESGDPKVCDTFSLPDPR